MRSKYCVLLTFVLCGIFLTCSLSVTIAANRATNGGLMPAWRIGDWWVVERVNLNIFSPDNEWVHAGNYVYKVVDEQAVGSSSCFVVEKWSYSLADKFDSSMLHDRNAENLNAILYFRVSDLSIAREVSFYRLGGEQKFYQRDFDQKHSIHIQDSGECLPAFPLVIGQSDLTESRDRDSHSQKVRTLPAKTLKTQINLKIAKDFRIKPLVDTLTGAYEVAISRLGRQVWGKGLPWSLYSEVGAGNKVTDL